ncbi:threonine dehydrogenase-like Zn-dependent dehydrogenase [Roseiarcus fermentans]|uniref:Threonine dehydrogenase-like Zn-dependent dehydrogenase n=1 Tax=Roseiarcus fermentans TaxID=1473586 RepID=A0A366FVD8_9HYPH|nr:zinc-dependent dehydrogenase [Roseiarcus fermentans]RBP18116.1 threonine dehydrogenase-like Zn-dependent dehydrogenase [Roseiarcus fermentans]
MKAAVYRAPGDIALEDRDMPVCGDDELLLRVRAASVCGTDMRIFKSGHFKIPASTHRVLGHEVAGVIAKVGRFVSGFAEGMRVTVTPNIGCGRCKLCRRGYNNMCPNYEAFGISLDGGFEDYMRVPNIAVRGGNVFAIPDGVSFEEAAVVEPLSCAFNAFQGLKVTPEDRVLIFGPGPIGAFFTQLAKLYGAKTVIVAGITDNRLETVGRMGADVLINTTRTDLAQEIANISNGDGVDVIVTAASAPQLQAQALTLLAMHGRVNFFGGLPKGAKVELDTNLIHYRGLHVAGTTGSSNEDYARAMQLVADGQINVRDIVTERYPLTEIGKAFDSAFEGRGMKAMVVPGD